MQLGANFPTWKPLLWWFIAHLDLRWWHLPCPRKLEYLHTYKCPFFKLASSSSTSWPHMDHYKYTIRPPHFGISSSHISLLFLGSITLKTTGVSSHVQGSRTKLQVAENLNCSATLTSVDFDFLSRIWLWSFGHISVRWGRVHKNRGSLGCLIGIDLR